MRKLRIFQHISLDGVIQIGSGPTPDPDFPYGDWTAPYRSPAGFARVTHIHGEAFDLILGRCHLRPVVASRMAVLRYLEPIATESKELSLAPRFVSGRG